MAGVVVLGEVIAFFKKTTVKRHIWGTPSGSQPACSFLDLFVYFKGEITETALKLTKKGWKWLKKCFDLFSGAASTWKLVEIHNSSLYYLWSFFAIRIFLFTFVYKPYKNKLWVFFTYLPHDIKWPQSLTTEFLVTKFFNLQLNFWFMVASEFKPCQSKPKKFSWTN